MPSKPLAATRSTSVVTWAARWLASARSVAMAGASRDSVTVGTTLMLWLRRVSMTVVSPAPACCVIVVAPVARYQNGEASPHRSALLVTEFSELDIDQYGSQPL